MKAALQSAHFLPLDAGAAVCKRGGVRGLRRGLCVRRRRDPALGRWAMRVRRRGGGGFGTRPWRLALSACGGAYWPLALEPSAMTSRPPHYCGHPHCRGHPPAPGGGGHPECNFCPWRPPLTARGGGALSAPPPSPRIPSPSLSQAPHNGLTHGGGGGGWKPTHPPPHSHTPPTGKAKNNPAEGSFHYHDLNHRPQRQTHH